MLYFAYHNIVTYRVLTSFTCLSAPTSSLLACFALIRMLVVNLSFVLPVPSPASYSPLRHLPFRSFSSSILLRLIAAQNGSVLIQQHLHESFPRSIPLLLRNPNRLHRFIPRFLIHGFRPSNKIDRLYFPSFARHNSSDNLQKTSIPLCRSFITSLYIHMFPVQCPFELEGVYDPFCLIHSHTIKSSISQYLLPAPLALLCTCAFLYSTFSLFIIT
jgi:hypothetical protein